MRTSKLVEMVKAVTKEAREKKEKSKPSEVTVNPTLDTIDQRR